MKKFLLLASALFVLGGCNVDKIEVDDEMPGEKLRIEARYDPATAEEAQISSEEVNGPARVAYNDPFDPTQHLTPQDHPAIDVTWAENDKIKVFDYTAQNKSAVFDLETGGHGSKFGVFTGTNPQQDPSNQLKAIYPVKDSYDSYWNYIKMDIVGQTQTGNRNMSHLADFDYMIGDVTLTDAATGVKSANVSLKRQIAVMKFVLSLPADLGTPEQLVMSTANKSFITAKTLETGTETKASQIMLGLSNVTVAAGEPLVAYLAALPFSLSGEDLNIKVIGTQKQYQFTATNVTVSYKAGEQYVAILNAADFTDVTPTGPVALTALEPAGNINGAWAQIGGLKITRGGTEETGVKVSKADMARGSFDMTADAAIDLIGGDVVELLANNNSSGAESGGYGAFWIDWNRDGILDNDTEAIMFPRNGTTPISAPEIAGGAENVVMYPATVGTFTVPDTKPDGSYYGRVMRDYREIVNGHTAQESASYIDFAINYKQVDVIPPGPPILTFIAPTDTDVKIYDKDVTRTFKLKVNKRWNSDIFINLVARTTNTGHNGTLTSEQLTIPAGQREVSGTITFAKSDFTEVGTHDAEVKVDVVSITGAEGSVQMGTLSNILYNVSVVDMTNAIKYYFAPYGQTAPESTEITAGNYYSLNFSATNGTIPDGTVVSLSFSGNNNCTWIDPSGGYLTGFPATVTISETRKSFNFGVWDATGNGTLTVTSTAMPTTPGEGIKINIP